jgi:hypothetical protein
MCKSQITTKFISALMLASLVVDGLYFVSTVHTSQQHVTDKGGTPGFSNIKNNE